MSAATRKSFTPSSRSNQTSAHGSLVSSAHSGSPFHQGVGDLVSDQGFVAAVRVNDFPVGRVLVVGIGQDNVQASACAILVALANTLISISCPISASISLASSGIVVSASIASGSEATPLIRLRGNHTDLSGAVAKCVDQWEADQVPTYLQQVFSWLRRCSRGRMAQAVASAGHASHPRAPKASPCWRLSPLYRARPQPPKR